LDAPVLLPLLPVKNGKSSQRDLCSWCLEQLCADIRDAFITEFLFVNAVLYLFWEGSLGFNE